MSDRGDGGVRAGGSSALLSHIKGGCNSLLSGCLVSTGPRSLCITASFDVHCASSSVSCARFRYSFVNAATSCGHQTL